MAADAPYSRNSKQVLERGKHYADARDEAAAATIADALNRAAGFTNKLGDRI